MFVSQGNTVIRHSIIYNNLPEVSQVWLSADSTMTLDSCLIQGGWPTGIGNIDIDPQFRDTANGDYRATAEVIVTKPLPTCENGSVPDSMEIWIYPTPTDVSDNSEQVLPRQFSLEQNFPNPFNPSTTIAFSLPHRGEAHLDIFNAVGQLVRRLDVKASSSGVTRVVWDGKDLGGSPVASGLYLYRITSGEFSASRKMMLLK